MKYFLFLLLLIFGGLYFVLYTPNGNDIVKPVIGEYLSDDVELKDFSLSTSQLDTNLTIQNRYNANIQGNISTLMRKFDLTYKVDDFLNGTLISKDISLDKITTSFTAKIPDLSKLEPLIGYKLRGELETKGIAQISKKRKISGFCKSFGGDIEYKIVNDKLTAKMGSIPISNLLYTLISPQILEGLLSGDVEYDINSKKGFLKANIENLKILPNQVTNLLKNYVDIDFAKEKFDTTSLTANIDNNLIGFNFDAKSTNSHVRIKDGLIKKAENLIDAKFSLIIDNKDFTGTIKGDLNNPNVELDSSQYIKEKLSKGIDDFINQHISKDTQKTITDKLKELGVTDVNATIDNVKNLAKDLLKEFF